MFRSNSKKSYPGFVALLFILYIICLVPISAFASGTHIRQLSLDDGSDINTNVMYDGQNHGIRFKIISEGLYGNTDATHKCTTDNSEVKLNGESVPFSTYYKNGYQYIMLTSPGPGIYSISIKASYSDSSYTYNASDVCALYIDESSLSSLVQVNPYTGTYDGTYHNSAEVNGLNGYSNYTVLYMNDLGEYKASCPMIKNVADTRIINYRIESSDPNLSIKEFESNYRTVISPKSVTIKVNNVIKCVGEPDPAFSCTVTGMLNNDKEDVVYTREPGEEIGQYLINVSQPDENKNYSFTYTPGTITIRNHSWKAPTYTWADDNSAVTGKCICSYDDNHILEETVPVTAAVVKEPTCTEKGQTKYSSDVFTSSLFNVQTKTLTDIEAIGHEWGEPTYNWYYSSKRIYAKRVCLTNSSHHEYEYQDISSEITKPATCTEKGKTTYTSNSFSNPAFSVQTNVVDIPALGHDWNTTYTWNDDNTQVTATRICSHDNSHMETETVGVTKSVLTNPTCINKGKTKYTSNRFSNNAFYIQTKTLEDIAPLGHDWHEASYTWNSDHSLLTASRICNRDKNHIETETTSVSAKVTKQPSCSGKGETTYTSNAFANDAFIVQEEVLADIDPLGHSWDTPTYSWSSDYSQATAARSCLRDASHIESETVSAVISTINPTCVEGGKTTYSASFINTAFEMQLITVDNGIPAKGHIPVADKRIEPTCTSNGLTEGSHCAVCGAILIEQAALPKIAHTEVVDSKIEPTCVSTGLSEGSHCAVCGTVIVNQIILPKIAHTAVIDPRVEPTCTATGLTEGSHCSVCGQVLLTPTIISAKGHTVVIDPATDGTYYNPGKTEGSHCSECGKVLIAQEPVYASYSTIEMSPSYYNYKLDASNSETYFFIDVDRTNGCIAYSDSHALIPGTYFQLYLNQMIIIDVYRDDILYKTFVNDWITDPVPSYSNVLLSFPLINPGIYRLQINVAYYNVNTKTWHYNPRRTCKLDLFVFDPSMKGKVIKELDGKLYYCEHEDISASTPGGWRVYNNSIYFVLRHEVITGAEDINGFIFDNEGRLIHGDDMFILPSAMSVVEKEAFSGLGMKAVVIPSSCKKISSKAFANCSNLKEVFFLGKLPDIAQDAFENTPCQLVYNKNP